MKSRARFGAGLPLLLLLLTGCGSDRPVLQQPPQQPRSVKADIPLPAGPTETASTDPSSGGPPDPLMGDARQARPDPLLGKDPLIGHDPLQGRAMPTKHSHWLNAEMQEARMMVQLNGVRLGAFVPLGTQDVTMMLRPGTNMLTVTYEPQNERSWGSVTLSEGEHNANAVMLASFRQAPLAGSLATDTERALKLKPVTKTIVFTAQ